MAKAALPGRAKHSTCPLPSRPTAGSGCSFPPDTGLAENGIFASSRRAPGDSLAGWCVTVIDHVTAVLGEARSPLAGEVAQLWLGALFLIAGAIKAAYDLVLWDWFRRVPLPKEVT